MIDTAAVLATTDIEPIPELLGIRAWNGTAPVILVAEPAAIEPVQQNYPRAHVVSLPPDTPAYAYENGWPVFIPLLGADVSLWPVNGPEAALFSLLGAVLDVAGVKTLRWATRATDDWARLESLETVWRDRGPLR